MRQINLKNAKKSCGATENETPQDYLCGLEDDFRYLDTGAENAVNDFSFMENMTLIQEMSAVVGEVKKINVLSGSRLGCPSKMYAPLDGIREKTGLETQEEALALVAIFDRQCSDNATDLSDLARYFRCSPMEVTVVLPALKSLLVKGYVRPKERNGREIRNMSLLLCENVFTAITEGGKISPIPADDAERFDQFAFCAAVHNMVEDRSRGKISTREFFGRVGKMEEENPELELVARMRAEIADLEARTWFYEICRDFSHEFEEDQTSLNRTLRDVYDNISDGIRVKSAMFDGSHPLFEAGLVRFGGRCENDSLLLMGKGLEILYGDAARAFTGNYQCEDKYEFLEKVDDFGDAVNPHTAMPHQFTEMYGKVEKLENSNRQLGFIDELKKVVDKVSDRVLFYKICRETLNSDNLSMQELNTVYYRARLAETKRDLKNGRHPLMRYELVEKTEGGFFEGAGLVFTDKGRELFLGEDVELFEEAPAYKDLLDSEKIVEKKLFFEPKLERQLSTLAHSLEEENLAVIRGRLEEKHLPSGIAVLFYGLPGTGKTESALQIARATGRAVMHVDISQTKSCWFGESEKKIKEVFKSYKNLCRRSKVKPILLFNEADAVFSKRKDSNSSNVAQTENAIQNIILEEMESLDGILLATTNLADNLDGAFERRFLFKIRFDKPSVESKVQIWKDKMPCLSDEDATILATAFDFSGGEIDNVARKVTLEEVIGGEAPTLEHLTTLCREEKISNGKGGKIGFCVA